MSKRKVDFNYSADRELIVCYAEHNKYLGVGVARFNSDGIEEHPTRLTGQTVAHLKAERDILKQKLQDKYDMKMTVELERRLNNMCNLSDLIEERGIRLGEERGIRLGEERGIRLGEERGIKIGEQNGIQKKLHEQIRKKLIRKKTLRQIADEVEENEEDILPLYEQVKQELESESAMRG